MLLKEDQFTMTTASGSASQFVDMYHGEVSMVILEPATSTTTYDITITNGKGVDIYENTNIEGKLNAKTELIVRDSFTLSISSASKDEAFAVYIGTIERYA